MGRIILVTGGSRSGKSAYAQKAAERVRPPRTFIATCPVMDDEMRERIRRHQEARSDRDWDTIEEPFDIVGALENAKESPVVLVDCLTLWINNLVYRAELHGGIVSEADVALECRRLIAACQNHPGTVFFVTSEIGMGIIPENALARLYRDLIGRCNQIIAEASHQVILLVCGQSLEIKNEIRSESELQRQVHEENPGTGNL